MRCALTLTIFCSISSLFFCCLLLIHFFLGHARNLEQLMLRCSMLHRAAIPGNCRWLHSNAFYCCFYCQRCCFCCCYYAMLHTCASVRFRWRLRSIAAEIEVEFKLFGLRGVRRDEWHVADAFPRICSIIRKQILKFVIHSLMCAKCSHSNAVYRIGSCCSFYIECASDRNNAENFYFSTGWFRGDEIFLNNYCANKSLYRILYWNFKKLIEE